MAGEVAADLTGSLLAPQEKEKTPTQKAVRKTLKGTAVLARLLPTGSVLAFQVLSPILTFQGQCRSAASRSMTLLLLGGCAVSCFVLCFTDSFRDGSGKIRHGLATPGGLWVIDGGRVRLSQEETERYRVKLVDFFHAFMSMLVFGAVALFDKNIVKCFYGPEPSEETRELLVAVPVGVGMACCVFFLVFPTKRHGIGCPLSKK